MVFPINVRDVTGGGLQIMSVQICLIVGMNQKILIEKIYLEIEMEKSFLLHKGQNKFGFCAKRKDYILNVDFVDGGGQLQKFIEENECDKRIGSKRYFVCTQAALFCGYFPAGKPQFTCLIKIYNPRIGPVYGSTVAAPLCKQIAESIIP